MRSLFIMACGLAVLGLTSATSLARPQDVYDATRAYVECMAEHGVPLPPPDAKGSINLSPGDIYPATRAARLSPFEALRSA